MSTLSIATASPEARRTELELLVLAADRDHCAGIDLASGALVRVWTTEPIDPHVGPYDVVAGPVDDGRDRLPDPTEPEAVVLLGAPSPVGRMVGRRAERYLRKVLHPAGRPLLGFHGAAVPFWERSRDHPSVALIEPEGPALVGRRGPSVWCRLKWRGRVVQLPCLDRRVGWALADSGRSWLEMGRTDRLVVILTPPVDGHCHKVVAGVLPRPGRSDRSDRRGRRIF